MPNTLKKTRNLIEEYGSLAILCFLLLALKSPDALSNAQLWGEDGTIFLSQQYGHILPQLTVPYAGYLHLIPRLTAWLATALPLRDTPLIYNAIATGIDAICILYFARRLRLFASTTVILAIFVLVPTNGEIFGTLTNVQWFAQFALFALAFAPITTQNTDNEPSVWPCIIASALSLTGPFSIFIALIVAVIFSVKFIGIKFRPVRSQAINGWIARSNKKILATIVTCGIIQLLILVLSGNRSSKGQFDLTLAKEIFFVGFQTHIFGQAIFANAIFLLVLLVTAYLAFKYAKERDETLPIFIGAMLAFSFSQILAIAHIGPNAHLIYTSFDSDRYFTFAKISFWILIAWILRNHRSSDDHTLEWASLVPLAFVAISHANQLRRPELPKLNWKHEVSIFENSPADSPRTIPINPAPWKITIQPRQETH